MHEEVGFIYTIDGHLCWDNLSRRQFGCNLPELAPFDGDHLQEFIFWPYVSPLDCKEIQPVHSEGDQPWDFFGGNDTKAETPVLWPPHAKSWLIGRDSDGGRDWGQEEKGTTEDEMAGWHHQLDGCEFEWTPGVGDGREAWRASIHGVAKSRTRLSDWTGLNWSCSLSLEKTNWVTRKHNASYHIKGKFRIC